MVGIEPDKFWKYTLRESGLLAKAFRENNTAQWEHTRQIEFALRDSTVLLPMGAKKIVKVFDTLKAPTDLYRLPADERIPKKEIVIDKERAEKAVNTMKQWLKTKD